jgi:hypothetical protein
LAQEISELRGVTYQGTPYRNYPGIDGWINGAPVSLKQITSGQLSSIRGAVETAIKKARKVHFTGVELFVKASDFSVADVVNYIQTSPGYNVTRGIGAGKTLSEITVFCSDGVLTIIGSS